MIEVSMKSTARTTVALDKKVAVPRGPNAVWLPIPPNAPARSAPRALCRSTEKTRMTATSTCSAVNNPITQSYLSESPFRLDS